MVKGGKKLFNICILNLLILSNNLIPRAFIGFFFCIPVLLIQKVGCALPNKNLFTTHYSLFTKKK